MVPSVYTLSMNSILSIPEYTAGAEGTVLRKHMVYIGVTEQDRHLLPFELAFLRWQRRGDAFIW